MLGTFLDMMNPFDEPSDDIEKMANALSRSYFKHKAVDRASDWVFNKLMPTTSDDYQQAVNEEEPLYTVAPRLTGQRVLQTINENLIEGKSMKDAIHGRLPAATNTIGRIHVPSSSSGLSLIRRLFGR